jgi:hypothetical protein
VDADVDAGAFTAALVPVASPLSLGKSKIVGDEDRRKDPNVFANLVSLCYNQAEAFDMNE